MKMKMNNEDKEFTGSIGSVVGLVVLSFVLVAGISGFLGFESALLVAYASGFWWGLCAFLGLVVFVATALLARQLLERRIKAALMAIILRSKHLLDRRAKNEQS